MNKMKKKSLRLVTDISGGVIFSTSYSSSTDRQSILYLSCEEENYIGITFITWDKGPLIPLYYIYPKITA